MAGVGFGSCLAEVMTNGGGFADSSQHCLAGRKGFRAWDHSWRLDLRGPDRHQGFR